jgi:hypothetical protein
MIPQNWSRGRTEGGSGGTLESGASEFTPMTGHISIRRESYFAGTREGPEVGVFTQTHTSRPPVPWGKIAVGDTIWMKWSGWATLGWIPPRSTSTWARPTLEQRWTPPAYNQSHPLEHATAATAAGQTRQPGAGARLPVTL